MLTRKQMREDVLRVVENYIDAVRRNDAGSLPLAPDVVFESPLNTIRGIEAFEKALVEFAAILKGVEMVRLTADDEACAAALRLDTVFGVVDFLEYFHLVEGRITSIKAYYDPRVLLEGMGKTKGA
jgi:hypothetical protein